MLDNSLTFIFIFILVLTYTQKYRFTFLHSEKNATPVARKRWKVFTWCWNRWNHQTLLGSWLGCYTCRYQEHNRFWHILQTRKQELQLPCEKIPLGGNNIVLLKRNTEIEETNVEVNMYKENEANCLGWHQRLRVRAVEPVSLLEFDPSSGLEVVEREGDS